MELKRIETPGIVHFAYLIADGTEAALVDTRRDVEDYLNAARKLETQPEGQRPNRRVRSHNAHPPI
jgi:hydroxyacylglutathione hydrolase